MKNKRVSKSNHDKMQRNIINLISLILIILFSTAFYLGVSFKPLSEEEHQQSYNKITNEVEPFRKNLTECARQVRASSDDVDNFLKKLPQITLEGKCFVACIFKRTAIIVNNKINTKYILELNREIYGNDNEVMPLLKTAMKECMKVVKDIFEVCEYASTFNDCMLIKMEHILQQEDKMARRMEALSKKSHKSDEWHKEEEEMMRVAKEEL